MRCPTPYRKLREVEPGATLAVLLDTTTLTFARVSTCVMLLPAIGGARVAIRARLALAVMLSLVLVPLAGPSNLPDDSLSIARALAGEMLLGALLGVAARLYVEALRFGASVVAGLIGFNPLGGLSLDGGEPDGPFTALVAVGGLMTFLAFDLHHLVVRAVAESYAISPVGKAMRAQPALVTVVDLLRASFSLALSIAGPFVIYSVVAQLLIGLVNKLAPAIPLYFIAMPTLLAGGLILFALLVPELLGVHALGLERALLR